MIFESWSVGWKDGLSRMIGPRHLGGRVYTHGVGSTWRDSVLAENWEETNGGKRHARKAVWGHITEGHGC